MKSIITNEYRCDCGKLLFKGLLLDSKIEIKCKRCQKIKMIGSVLEGMTGNNDYTVVYDRQGKIVDASQSMEEILGYSGRELRSRSIKDINPLISPIIFDRTWQLAGETENYLFWETYHQKKDGTKIFVDARINVADVGKNERLIFIHRVLPDPLEAEEEEGSSDIELPVRDFVLDIDWRGRIIYSSLDIESSLGYRPIDIFSKSVFDYIPQGYTNLSLKILKKMIIGGKSFHLKKGALLKKNGKILKLESFFSPIFDEKGNTWGFSSSNWIK